MVGVLKERGAGPARVHRRNESSIGMGRVRRNVSITGRVRSGFGSVCSGFGRPWRVSMMNIVTGTRKFDATKDIDNGIGIHPTENPRGIPLIR
jgi:hypothetical protein